eukprot:gene10666-14302_t
MLQTTMTSSLFQSAVRRLLLLSLVLLCACASRTPATVEPVDDLNVRIAPWVLASGKGSKPVVWEHFKLPGKRPSTFEVVREEKRVAVAAN